MGGNIRLIYHQIWVEYEEKGNGKCLQKGELFQLNLVSQVTRPPHINGPISKMTLNELTVQ